MTNGKSNNKISISSIPREASHTLGVKDSVGEYSSSGGGSKKDKPHIVLPGLHILDCNYGPEQNKWNKKKAAECRERKQNVDHPQASVSKVQIQCGHKVDCPTWICIKKTFLLEGYQHIIYKGTHFR